MTTAPTTSSCPPRWVTPPPQSADPTAPNYVEGAWFDQAAVDKVCAALRGLRHTKGRWARSPLEPEPWQIEHVIAPVFGWKHPDGNRIVRTVYVEIPRKNGKSTLSSGLAIVLLVADGEMGAEVYAAASTMAQARIVYDEAKKMAMRAPQLRGKVQLLSSVMKVPGTGGVFRVLSKVAEAAHGLNVSGAVIDELHVHKRRDLVDAIETGTGAREQPLVIIITTADEGEEGTIYAEKHERTRKLAQGIIEDPTFYGIIWAADDEDDPFEEATWRKCNPGLGVTVKLEYLRKEAERARTEPSYFPTFCRLHLNRRIRQTTRFLNLVEWDAPLNSAPLDVANLRGRECYGGLDLSATTDLTSLQVIFPDDNHERLDVLSWFWLPEDGLAERIERDQVPYDRWAEDGYLTLTEGNVVDYDKVIETLLAVRDAFDLRSVSHDRWQAGAVVQSLGKGDIDAVPVPQSYAGMSAATKELERLVKQARFHHGGHPVLRWNADCVEVIRDNSDNVRPVKPKRQSSTKRVDGITAGVMALDGWMRRPELVHHAPATAQAAPPNGESMYRPKGRLNL